MTDDVREFHTPGAERKRADQGVPARIEEASAGHATGKRKISSFDREDMRKDIEAVIASIPNALRLLANS
ncbi:hypothetical protein K6V98_00100 [Collinsella sp. AGMB00827]|uniref:Uncharacterized protein n=1 Tax=Collinsella ureilytica TaxID=2869515 RepID=A0ABS7MHD3_9ACTN|nr:hypothetical protein [Collinsella urealyticum]MBY4796771.1 hypothetical protein [Collinsella urealyticum]